MSEEDNKLKVLYGHESVLKYITQSVELERLGSTYIFAGPSGIGKTLCAQHSARIILCKELKDGEPCLECPSCHSFQEVDSHPTLITVDFKNNKQFDMGANNNEESETKSTTSKVDAVRIFINEVERASGLNRTVYLIKNLEDFSYQVQNTLLKTFEEPPANAIFILCSDRPNLLLETIKSRAQVLHLSPLSRIEMSAVLKQFKVEDEKLDHLINVSEGSVELALKFNEDIYQLLLSWSEQIFQSQTKDFLKKAEEVIEISENLSVDDIKKKDIKIRDYCKEFFKVFEKLVIPKILKKSRHHFIAWNATNSLITELMEAKYALDKSGHLQLSIEHYFQKLLARLEQIDKFLKMKEIDPIDSSKLSFG